MYGVLDKNVDATSLEKNILFIKNFAFLPPEELRTRSDETRRISAKALHTLRTHGMR